ncbi:bilirubin oxidase [Prauserella sediminis]|uniref:Bilirubin oxidase n=1 Tax=Prauserella sediminis TaxID=577680 RepID=A0A839XJD2_9PSEU|nr:multicopper oxidase domain-containing protein [Prauserella sediminis]MBB3661664.1 bilirubin oxidase [Prauserella sediminis]
MNDFRAGFDRRAFLRLTALGVGAGAAVTLTGCSIFDSRDSIDTVGQVDFRNRLHIPPLAESTRQDGTTVFDLTAQAGRSAVVPGGEADTWGINGPLLGPTLRAKRGAQVQINVTNELDEATTLHWHGMHLPAAADGGPHQMIEPGDVWSPSWRINQPAATLWYHPHPHGQTERHVYRGMGGLFIIDDEHEARLDLLREYGVDDIPVIVQDKTFDEHGRLVETSRRDNGMIGDTILVNGTAGPVLDITARRTRLRVLNASTARSYSFGFSDDREFSMIASDGGLLREPVALTRMLLTPGERAEIIVEMTPNDTTTLRSYPQDLGLSEGRSRSTGATDTLDILLLQAGGQLLPSAPVPARLATIEPLDESTAAETREFELRNNRINGESMDMNRIDDVVTIDTTEVWEVWNGHGQPHNFHVHDVQFQILDIDGRDPSPELSGWKDTVYLPPDVRFRLIMRFTEYTDPDVPYMYHCHLLWHEDEGMMGQFVVVERGQEPGAVDGDHDH